jgi:hypothetical protein
MSVQKSDYALPFAIEWSNNPAVDECEDRRFAKLADAWRFIERIEVKYRCIWLSEIGSYITKDRLQRTDWMYFWWSDAVASADWGERPGRRTGYAVDYPSTLHEYEPFAEADRKPVTS